MRARLIKRLADAFKIPVRSVQVGWFYLRLSETGLKGVWNNLVSKRTRLHGGVSGSSGGMRMAGMASSGSKLKDSPLVE